MDFSVENLLIYIALFAVVIAVIGVVAWVFKTMISGTGAGAVGLLRGRERRLGIQETTSVDGRRRLILIRRDNVSHLIMTGGPVDVVIETGIQEVRSPTRAAPGQPVAFDPPDVDPNEEQG